MIKPSELRIGNYLMYGGMVGSVVEISSKIPYVIIQFPNGNRQSVNSENAFIPLTEEWLVDFRFEKDVTVWINEIALYKHGQSGFNYNASYFEHDNLVEINYVHQLQNLYFALTATELTTNKNK